MKLTRVKQVSETEDINNVLYELEMNNSCEIMSVTPVYYTKKSQIVYVIVYKEYVV